MMLHWVLNDNTCFLTTVERKLRKKMTGAKNVDDDCVTCKLIEPIWDFRKNYETFTNFIYIITISLWLTSSCKLCYKYYTGQIKHIIELFIL
ncbi:MAG: hypothetical protein CMF62_00485 [Magnetococcales bacterium]|nr:hypothetical protein [Magnetococcales bacterium]